MEKLNAILADCPADELGPFVEGCSEASGRRFTVLSRRTSHLHGSKLRNLFRISQYFGFAFKMFLHRSRYGCIVAWQQFFGINLAFFLRLFRCRKTFGITLMTFIYKPKRGLPGRLYERFVRFCLSGQYIDRAVVFSKEEVERYSTLFGLRGMGVNIGMIINDSYGNISS